MTRTVLLILSAVAIAAGCSQREATDATPETAASPPPAVTAEPAPAPPADAEPFPADAAGAEEGGDCNAEPVQRLVGELYTPEVGEEARVEAGARVERALRPGQIVTMEFLSDRLSFTLDESGRITAANCG